MKFNRLDLNLLVALDALLTHQSISRAAERLNLTPSALSSALSRLREYFDDELLVQVGRKMEPTPRAQGLHDAVRDVLVRIDSTIAIQPQFDPASTDRTFRIFVSDYSQMVVIPHLLTLAAEQRCSARFEFLPQVSNPQRSLERGEADLLIIPRGFMSPDHPEELLYEEGFLCTVWQNSELAKGELTYDRYLASGHIVMQPPGGAGESFETWFIKRYGVARKVAITTYSFTALPMLVQGTEYIATVHARLARLFASTFPLALKAPPIPIEHMQQAVQWHRYRTQDPGLAWLRQLLKQAVLRMDDEDARRASTVDGMTRQVT
ncbi:LysR family transcriptional regulator [Roseateles koreensis]|uniref:LysR family transcriptional regulator n=1 Tax=Roseateles koreensis TaxID=2987526 RepID=A0ABT5KNZ8_9BURK|nr:LysR family transcriptional regulator [Roseateles koreensis]MDC8784650.1 LysR family transcriptional regulator [Roseateles koreensis]